MKFDCPQCKGKGKISYSLHDINKPTPPIVMKLLGKSILPEYLNGNKFGMYLNDKWLIDYSEEYVGKTQDELIKLLKTGEL